MKSDLFAAVRTLRRRPALTAAIIATIGIALAANTALLAIFDGLLFRPLPFPDADRLVYVEFPADLRRALPRPEVRRLDSLRATIPLLADRGLAEPLVIVDEGAAEIEDWRLSPARISPGLLRTLGIRPAAGRVFTEEDAGTEPPFSALRGTGEGWTLYLSDGHARAGPPAVMIGFELWQDRYGGDPSLVGQRLDLHGGIFRERPVLIGVMPRGFSFPDGASRATRVSGSES